MLGKSIGAGAMGFPSLLTVLCLDQACLFACLFYSVYVSVLKLKNRVLNCGTFSLSA